MSSRGSTCVCVLTPEGRGAVAVVAVEGDGAVMAVDRYFEATNNRKLGDQPVGQIVYGHWGGLGGEDLIVSRRTGESLEIHCHGGRQSSAQIVADLTIAGCTVVDAKQWLVHQHRCPIAVAAHTALAQTTTFRAAAILLAQYHGALRREIEAIVIDLAENNTTEAISRLECLMRRSAFGRHLTEPWRVVIAGLPNVGKSSLINALVGYQRAIVFDQPGTTRDVISSTTAIDGWPVELSDTAGLHEVVKRNDVNAIESAGMELARQRLDGADLVVWVLEAVELDSHCELSSWALARKQAEALDVQLDPQQTQLVINKTDLSNNLIKLAIDKDPQSVGTCAVTGAGIGGLLATISRKLVPNAPPPEAAVPFTVQQIDTLQIALTECCRVDREAATRVLSRLLS